MVEGGRATAVAVIPVSSVQQVSAPGKGELQIVFFGEVRMCWQHSDYKHDLANLYKLSP